MDTFAIFLVDAATVAVKAAQFITNGFQGAKVIFNAVLELLFTGIHRANAALAGLAEKAAALPVVGEGFRVLAEGFRSSADGAEALAYGFGQMKDQALDSAASTNAGFEAVVGVLGQAREAMEAARGKTVELAAEARNTLPPAMEEAATRTKEQADKIAETFRTLQQEMAVAQTEGITQRLVELDNARTNELEGLRELKGLTAAEYDELVAMVNEKYDLMAAKVRDDYNVQLLEAATTAQNELELLQTTGIERRLLELDQAHEAELEKLRTLTGGYGAEYEALAQLVGEKYAQMRAAAEITHEGIVAAANEAGFQTRAQLEETADRALRLYEEMLASGQFTYGELEKAHAAYKAAEEQLNDEKNLSTMQKFELLAESASGILRSLFGKSKAAAIAAAIIDTAAAVAKALSAYPWPFNLGPAAAALAAGLAQVNTIRSTDYSARFGSTETRFQDFGRGTAAVLHGQEAVVTRGQAASVAAMVEEAIAAGGARAGGGGGIVVRMPDVYLDGERIARGTTRRQDSGFGQPRRPLRRRRV